MSEFGKQIIFKQLLDNYGRVEVPRIQRDYAQGRETEAEVRDEFLGALHFGLSLPANDPKLPLNLDFIYGSMEGNGVTRFLPLDGQQRLTTLFLLHWYAGWQDNRTEDFRELLCPEGFSRFSYSVRPSSAEFFDALVKFVPDCESDAVEKLSKLIKNQSWYFRHWRLDPTIQSCLRMLESIHEKFRYSKGIYARLTDVSEPAITFQLLNLANFGLSDDLYIKMNARGKPLTPFETFKARYEQELHSQFKNEFRKIGTDQFCVAEFFSRRMDVAWAEFFWSHRDPETNLYDDAVMNLFRVVVLATRDPDSEYYLKDVAILRNEGLKSSFTLFHSRNWLDRTFSENLILLLETWSGDGPALTLQLPDTTFFDEVDFFQKAASRPTDFGYSEIVQIVAYLAYLSEHETKVDPVSFQEWMRIVSNLATNTSYDRAADMQRSVAGILGIAPYSGDILTYFATTEKPTTGFSPQQVLEEKLKAELILAHEGWRTQIDRAEKHGYFKGQIEFLLDFSGVLERWRKEGGVKWDVDEHQKSQYIFEQYLVISDKMFGNVGLRLLTGYRWQRALLTLGNYLLPSGRQNWSFLINSSAEQGSWKRLLRGAGRDIVEKRNLLRQLWDQLSPDLEIASQLDQIIASADNLILWRKALVENPEAIEYCGNRSIRLNSKHEIYLLSKTQMNGAHAELFTYCLFQQLLADKKSGNLSPLNQMEYYFPTETAIEPGIRFNWVEDNEGYFDLEWSNAKFVLYRLLDSAEEQPAFISILVEEAGFEIKKDRIIQWCDHSKIRELITTLRRVLLRYSQSRE